MLIHEDEGLTREAQSKEIRNSIPLEIDNVKKMHQANLEPKMVRQLPVLERKKYIEAIIVEYPDMVKIIAQMQRRFDKQSYSKKPLCMLISGATGTGKSTIAAEFSDKYPRVITDEGMEILVLSVTVPPSGSISDLATEMLSQLGDPRAEKDAKGLKTRRLKKYLVDCKTKMIIFDEIQHFYDKQSEKVLYATANWLKTLIKDTLVACILIGLEEDAEIVVNTNPQLSRLFGDPYKLNAFAWNWLEPKTKANFQHLMQTIGDLLPLQNPSKLDQEDIAWRCWVASEGILGYLMTLIRKAAELALDTKAEYIDLAILAAAYDEELGGERRGVANPFVGEAPSKDWKPKPKVYQTTTTRRRGRPGRKGESLSDVLLS